MLDRHPLDGDGLCNLGDSDDDGDSVLDEEDNCPMMPNVEQEDTDGDGSGDYCDDDSDNDGVPDGEDNCPVVANVNQADLDDDDLGDLCDPDRDGDGIPEDGDETGEEGDNPCLTGELTGCDDNCPEAANPDQQDTDLNGVGDVCDHGGGGCHSGGSAPGSLGWAALALFVLIATPKRDRAQPSRTQDQCEGTNLAVPSADRHCDNSFPSAPPRLRRGGAIHLSLSAVHFCEARPRRGCVRLREQRHFSGWSLRWRRIHSVSRNARSIR